MVVVLSLMSVTGLHAQMTYNDTVRTNSWTVYVTGGVSGYHDFRGGSVTGVSRFIAPDISLGLKYNLNSVVRFGLNFGYTKLKAKNADIEYNKTVIEGFQIGEYKDAILTIDNAVLVNRTDNHLAGGDLNVEVNFLEPSKERNQRWNLWFGTGIGFYHGWSRNTLTTAVSEEAVAKGDDHFNIYTKDYITTDATFMHVNALYIPARLSLEFDVTPRVTFGVKAEYKYMPQDKIYTSKGLWSTNATFAYNFVKKRFNRKSIKAHYEEIITDMNSDIARLRDEVSVLTDRNVASAERIERLDKEVDNTKAALIESQRKQRLGRGRAKSTVSKVTINDISIIAQILNDYPKAKAYVKGYASPDGNAEYSPKLGGLRAEDVADILVKDYKIKPERISTEDYEAQDRLYKVFIYDRVAVITVEIPI